MQFEVLGEIRFIREIASGRGIRDLRRLIKQYGGRRWRKLKGLARIRLQSDIIVIAELHWYEAHGVGRRELKIKRIIEHLP